MAALNSLDICPLGILGLFFADHGNQVSGGHSSVRYYADFPFDAVAKNYSPGAIHEALQSTTYLKIW